MSEPTFICTRCHDEAPMSERRELDARDYCSRCLDAITAICHICGTRFPSPTTTAPRTFPSAKNACISQRAAPVCQ